MNKIICDVCGTSYPDTSSQCPICGNAKAEASAPMGTAGAPGNDGYAYVKGGRFSQSNVRKHNSGSELPRQSAQAKPARERSAFDSDGEPARPTPRRDPSSMPQRRRPSEEVRRKERNTNLILWAIIVILILAIIAVCCFIVVRLLDMYKQPDPNLGNNGTTTSAVGSTTTQPSTTQPKSSEIPCVGIQVAMPSYTFNTVGDKLLLGVKPQPENTTDPIVFTSSDPRIATVDEDGEIVAVADGTAIITVSCGGFTAQCEITCRVGVEPDYDIHCTGISISVPAYTFRAVGEKLQLVVTPQPANTTDPITYTSNNPSVATVSDSGEVIAVAEGTAIITVNCGSFSAICEITCSIETVTTNPTTKPTNPGTSNPAPGETKVYGYFCKQGYLNVRADAGPTYAVVGKLNPNIWVEILEQKEVSGEKWGRTHFGWVKITGYIEVVESDTDLTVDTKYVGTMTSERYNSLNIREGAGSSYSIVGKINKGDQVEILEFKTVDGNLWGRIDGGWILLTDMVTVEVVEEEA